MDVKQERRLPFAWQTTICLLWTSSLLLFLPFFLFKLSYKLAECSTMLNSDIYASGLSTCYTSLCTRSWTSTPLMTVEKMYCVYIWRRNNYGASLLFILAFLFSVLCIHWLLSQSYFFYVINSIIAQSDIFHISFSTSSYSLACFTSFKYLTQIAQFSYPLCPTEIWLISYIHPFPLDFTSIMTDGRTIWSMMIFLAYSITFFSLMIILREMHFFLCAHQTHYFFVWRSCLVCSITSSLWEMH